MKPFIIFLISLFLAFCHEESFAANTIANYPSVSSVTASDAFYDWQGTGTNQFLYQANGAQLKTFFTGPGTIYVNTGQTITLNNSLTATANSGTPTVGFGGGGTVLYASTIGSSVQAYSTNLALLSSLASSSNGYVLAWSTSSNSYYWTPQSGAASISIGSNANGIMTFSSSVLNFANPTNGASGLVQNDATGSIPLGLLGNYINQSGGVDAYGAAAAVLATSLQKSNNLSDLTSASTARTNLGLGTLSTSNSITTSNITGLATGVATGMGTAINTSGGFLTDGGGGYQPPITIGSPLSTYVNLSASNVLTTSNAINGTGSLVAIDSAGDIAWLGSTDTGSNSIAIGKGSSALVGTVSIGQNATSTSNSVAIGTGATTTTGSFPSSGYSVAIGYDAQATDASIAIGANSVATSNNPNGLGIAIGNSAVEVQGGTAVGSSAYAYNGVAFGNNSQTSGISNGSGGVSIGNSAVSSIQSIAIGNSAYSTGTNSPAEYGIAIGTGAVSTGYGTEIGTGTNATSNLDYEAHPIASSSGALLSSAAQTVSNASTTGTITFSEPVQGASIKIVIATLSTATGTATYTFPTPFTVTPTEVDNLGLASSISTTSATWTGTATSKTSLLIGY